MEKQKVSSILYFISGILFFIASMIGKNHMFIPIGCCFVVLGITNSNKKDKKSK